MPSRQAGRAAPELRTRRRAAAPRTTAWADTSLRRSWRRVLPAAVVPDRARLIHVGAGHFLHGPGRLRCTGIEPSRGELDLARRRRTARDGEADEARGHQRADRKID